MKKEDMEFLKKLQKEMLTQDNYGEAPPRFWAVMTKRRIYWVHDDIHGHEIVLDGESIGESVEEAISYMKEYFDESGLKIEEWEKCSTIFDFVDTLEKEGWVIDAVPYRDIDVIAENTFFLTLEECKKHIELNKYHYIEPYPYCMTAWRSSQVERLFSILESTNWDELKDLGTS